jgi:hypothetical protein
MMGKLPSSSIPTITIADFPICGNLPVCREQLKIISMGLQTVDAVCFNIL